jgi:hypothetical protein
VYSLPLEVRIPFATFGIPSPGCGLPVRLMPCVFCVMMLRRGQLSGRGFVQCTSESWCWDDVAPRLEPDTLRICASKLLDLVAVFYDMARKEAEEEVPNPLQSLERKFTSSPMSVFAA